MKKILLSLGIIAFVAVAAVGATYAVWSASDTIEGNTVSTAQLSITASGVQGGTPVATPLPFTVSNMLPGMVTAQEERAIITNTSDVPLDLYMYLGGTGGTACSAMKLAWQSSHPNNGVIDGYTSVPTDPGDVDEDGDNNFDLVYSPLPDTGLWGVGNKVLIAPADEFEHNEQVALRQVVGLATDAANSLQGQSCAWTLYFVAEVPTTVTP